VVSSDGKKENYKEDSVYLLVNQTRKPTMVWETLLGCRCNHVKQVESCDGAGNGVRAAQESEEEMTE
jgi:hypothetical protein